MKRIHPLFLSALFALLFAFGAVYVIAGTDVGKPGDSTPSTSVKRAVFEVSGVTCGSCGLKIRRALKGVPGITAVDVDIEKKTVTVDYKEGETDPKALAEAISGTGYPALLLESSSPSPAGVKPASIKKSGCGGGCCG
ncbi:heavy-metal-associated domain-containing protein [bacterium]|nr:MAG: heavy-metal-associated domain-containing protein [bacterium]